MKPFILLLLTICLFFSSSNAQSPVEYGFTAEGALFMPRQYMKDLPENRSTVSAGLGMYASKSINQKFSTDIGITYRFKYLREYFSLDDNTGGYGGYGGYGGGYGYGGYGYYDPGRNYDDGIGKSWKSYPLHYLILPIHLNYHIDPWIFIRGGIEASWLTNFSACNGKTEFNWVVGLGAGKNKLKWSLNYIRGFKDVEFNNRLMAFYNEKTFSIYRNQMIQLNVSYPIWQKK